MVNRQKFKIVVLLASVTLFIAGCAVAPQSRVGIPPNPANPIKRVAILPVFNNSNDVDAPINLREAFHNRLGGYYYDIQPLAETSQILNQQMGITLGKQFDMATPEEIGKTLGVDGLFYGYLLDFDEVTTGVANIYKVRIGWKLVDTKTGKTSWAKGVAVRRTQSLGNIAGAMHALGAGTDGLGLTQAEKIEAVPGSKDPVNEMPGLGAWVSMGDESVSLAGGLFGAALGKLTNQGLKKESNFAYDRLFSGMLVGPAAK